MSAEKLAGSLRECPECGTITMHYAAHMSQQHGMDVSDELLRDCEYCGSEYSRSKGQPNQRYCSPECSTKSQYKKGGSR